VIYVEEGKTLKVGLFRGRQTTRPPKPALDPYETRVADAARVTRWPRWNEECP
jgi:hypothetical protein